MKKKRTFKNYKGDHRNGPVKIIKASAAKPTQPVKPKQPRSYYIPANIRSIMREEW